MERNLAAREKALVNIMKAIEAGIFNETTAARIKEFEDEVKTLERSIASANVFFDEEIDTERI